jgi:hypothetical protein
MMATDTVPLVASTPAERIRAPLGGFNLTALRLEIRRVRRNRRTLFFILIFPSLFFFIFGLSSKGVRTGGDTLLGYLMISMAVYGAMVGTTSGSATVASWLCSFVFAAFGLFVGTLFPAENVMQFVGPARRGRDGVGRGERDRLDAPLWNRRHGAVQARHRPRMSASTVVLSVALVLSMSCSTAAAQRTGATQTSSSAGASTSTPLLKQLPRFSAPGVPALGPAEIEVPARVWDQPIPAGLPGKGMAQHPMLYIGEGYNKILLVNDGRIAWTYSTGPGWEYDDVWMLSNGNVLFTRMQYVAEVTPEKQVVWRYDAPEGREIHTCQPIGLDKVMFVMNGLPPKLMVVNIKTNRVEVEHDLPAPSLTDPKTVHAQFRRARVTAQGTYLVPFLSMKQVVEYDSTFKEVWRYDIRSPWAAVRLKNGNTLITNEHDTLTVEVNPRKETVWSLRPSDLPEEYRFLNTQSATRLANGNTIIASRGGNGKGPQLVEVTPDKKVVWVLRDWANFGPATAVQILDDPGIPEVPGQSEH